MHHQMWTLFNNLNDCFDSWKAFVLSQGFAMKINGESGEEVIFTEEQKRRISNIDETNSSLDRLGGSHGGWPCLQHHHKALQLSMDCTK